MQPGFDPLDVELHRIGRRLVDTGHGERAGIAALQVAGERDDIADRKVRFREQLPRDEDARRSGWLREH